MPTGHVIVLGNRCINWADLLKRSFADKDEWRSLLQKLQEEGILSYTSEKDEIVVPLATE